MAKREKRIWKYTHSRKYENQLVLRFVVAAVSVHFSRKMYESETHATRAGCYLQCVASGQSWYFVNHLWNVPLALLLIQQLLCSTCGNGNFRNKNRTKHHDPNWVYATLCIEYYCAIHWQSWFPDTETFHSLPIQLYPLSLKYRYWGDKNGLQIMKIEECERRGRPHD